MFNPDGMLETYCGSPFYAAPEMIIGEKYVGPEVDVWSMGVILYTLLCGRLPFHDLVPRVLYERILSGNPEMPAFLSAASVDLMQRMMTVDREKRITLQEAMSHPWVMETYEGPPPSLVPARRPIGEIDRNILQQLPMYALDPRDAETQLRAPVMNAYMATYYLLLEKQERERAEALARRQQAEAQKRLHLAKQQELHQRQQAGWRNSDSADMDADEPAAAASPTTAAASPFTSFKGSQTVRSQRRARTLAGPASLELQRATAVASAVANALAAASTATAMAQLAVDQPASGRTTPVTPTSAVAAAPSPATSMHVEPAVPRPGTPGLPTAAAGHPMVHGGVAGPTVAAQVAQRAVYGTPVALPTAVPYTTVPAGPAGSAWTTATAGGAVAAPPPHMTPPHGYVPAAAANAAAGAAGQPPQMAMQWPLMSGRTLDASGRAAAARSRYHSTDPSRVEPIRRAVATYLAGSNQGQGAAGTAPGTSYGPPGAVNSAYMQAQNHKVFAAAVAAAGGGAAGGVPTMSIDGGQAPPSLYDAAAMAAAAAAAGGLPGDGPIGPGGLRTVGGLFSVETSSALPLAQVEAELVRVLESSGIVYTRDHYAFHCTYVPPPNPMQPPQPPLLFDAEICQIQRLELYGIRFCRLDGDIWLYKQAVQHIKAQLRL